MVNVTYTPDGSMVVNYDPSLGADGVATCTFLATAVDKEIAVILTHESLYRQHR